MGACIFSLSFFLSLVISTFASANITSVTGEDVCIGDNATYVCSVTGSGLSWTYEGSNAGYSAGFMTAQPLGPFQTEFVSICNGVVMSRATVMVSESVANTVNETTIFCDTANFTINIKESAPISYLMIQLVQGNAIMLHWGGAQCVLHYIVEVDNGNGVTVNTTTDTSYSYTIPDDARTMFSFTVHGVDYVGNNFTNFSQTFIVTGPICRASDIVSDNGIVYIMIESGNVNQLPIINCTLTFDSTIYDCSENRNMNFTVPPGEYNYMVEMRNAVDLTDCGNGTATVSMAPSPTCITTPTTSAVTEIPPYALGVIIVLSFLLIVAILMIAVLFYIIWKLWSSQDKNHKRVNTTNLRTTSPVEKDMSKM